MFYGLLSSNLITMSYPTPTQAEANEASQQAQNAFVANANNALIQSIIVLINNAMANGLYAVFPSIITGADYNVVAAYFTALDYTVSISFPPPPYFGPGFYPNGVPMGFPEVTGGFLWWNPQAPPPPYPSPQWPSWLAYVQRNHPTMIVSWGVEQILAEDLLELENGDILLLENGIDGFLLED